MDYSSRFFFTMTDVLSKSEGPNSFNMDFNDKKHSEENDKKQKLVYTSDFLRKFDKKGNEKEPTGASLFHSHIPTQIIQQQIPLVPPISTTLANNNNSNNSNNSNSLTNNSSSSNSTLPLHMNPDFYHDPLEKERQNLEYRNIIQRLKQIILYSKDENLINMMKVILSEYQYGKSFIDEFGVYSKKFDNQIQNFVYLGDLPTQTPSIPVTPLSLYSNFNSISNNSSGGNSNVIAATSNNTTTSTSTPISSTSTTPSGTTTPTTPSSGSLPPLKSPRKLESSSTTPSTTSNPITIPPLPLQQQSTPSTQGAQPYKSPRKISQSNESNNTISTQNNIIQPPIQPPSQQQPPIQPPTQQQPIQPPPQQQTSLTNSGNKMKKSPSMPVIASKKSDNTSSGMGFDFNRQKLPPVNTTPTKNNNLSKSKEENAVPTPLIPPSFPGTGTTRRPLQSSTSFSNIGGMAANSNNSNSNSSFNMSGPSSGGSLTPSISSGSISSLLDHQPRKPMTKSVSMSSISQADNNATFKCTSLEEITGQIYHLTKYQAGCRFLQKKLEENPDKEHVTLIFKEVYEHLIELMIDPYGQYLIPQLMKYCDNEQRRMIVDKIAPKVESFACHIYGIHGIQKVLQFLSNDQVESIIDSIRGKVIALSKDAKGNYLIQSFLKQFPPEVNQFIVNAIMENVQEICTHKVGCTVVNRCIDHSNPDQLEKLVDRITQSSMTLVQDQYGNYVVQHLLSNNKSYATKLIKSLLGHIAELSIQKFSSNVIEKCLQVANHDTYESIIKEITEADILNLLQDKYANFVIQTALDVADENQHAKLVKLIVPYIHQIKTPYVIHIQKKILQV